MAPENCRRNCSWVQDLDRSEFLRRASEIRRGPNAAQTQKGRLRNKSGNDPRVGQPLWANQLGDDLRDRL